MQSTETLAFMCRYQAKSRRSPCMPRPSTKRIDEYRPLAKDSEALWAIVGVIALCLILHLVEYH